MPPFVPDDLKVDAQAWEPGLSNNIIILGKEYPLVKAGNTKLKRVRNFVDDPTLDFNKEAFKRGIPFSPVRPRKGKPSTMDELKKQIQFAVIHTDLAKHARQTFTFLIGKDPTPLSTHFCINWNGVIYQYADVADRTAHGGETNDITIGIDMNLKMVNLSRSAMNASKIKAFNQLRKAYKNLAREKLREMFPGMKKKRLDQELEKYEFERPRSLKLQGTTIRSWGYTAAQYDSLILLLKLFVRELDLEKSYPMTPDGKVIPQLLADDDLKMLKGFVGHWHLSDQRWDPGPAFDWERVLSGMQNEYNWFPLVWDESMILQGRDISKANAAAYELMRNTETARRGGTFPIGPNQTWHGGVHLFPPKENGKSKIYPVHAMFDGVVVAAHFEKHPRQLGHNNFVLLRHEIEVPRPDNKVDENGILLTTKLRFYSLYMHLESMRVDKEGANDLAARNEKLGWVKRLYELEEIGKNSTELDKALEAFEEKVKAQRDALQEQLDNGGDVDEAYKRMLVDVDVITEQNIRIDDSPGALSVGFGSTSLTREDQVAILSDEGAEVRVSAGEWVGFTGLLRDPEEETQVRGVHVEILATEDTLAAIDLDVHSDHFRELQRARGSDLTVRTEDLLLVFRDAGTYKPYRGIQLWPDERIDPDDIIEFFAAEPGAQDNREAYREQLRRSISYHVSEWSDQVDWISAITGGNPWGQESQNPEFRAMVEKKGLFSDEIRKFIPYIWLNSEVATKVGLAGAGEWDGRVYHVHPIHWVMWVTYHANKRNRVFNTSLSLADLRRRQARVRAIRNLTEKGRKAKKAQDTSAQAWFKFQSQLEKDLAKRPFYLDSRKRKKDDKAQKEYEELTRRIIEGATSELEMEDHDESHGVVEVDPPVYSNPAQVLEELFELPQHNEWDIIRDDG